MYSTCGFDCFSDTYCIHSSLVCDRYRNCPNNVDEAHCEYSKSRFVFLRTRKMKKLWNRSIDRLQDHFSQLDSIDLKFSVQICFVSISIVFELEKNLSCNDWVIENILIFQQTDYPWADGIQDFLHQNIFLSIIRSIRQSNRFFTRNSNLCFRIKHDLKR